VVGALVDVPSRAVSSPGTFDTQSVLPTQEVGYELPGNSRCDVTIVFLAWAAWLRGRKLQAVDQPLSAPLGLVLLLLLGIVAVIPPLYYAMSFFAAGEASGASLEYGPILLWAATLVGVGSVICSTFSAGSTRPVLNAPGRHRRDGGRLDHRRTSPCQL
jgi:hypothetical protein